MAYATLSELRSELKLGASETGDDTLLTNLLTRVQAFIDAQTGRTFEASGDTTHYLDALADVKGRTLWVRADLCAITTVTNGDGAVLASNEYVTEPRNATPYYALTLKASSEHVWTYTTDPENAISVVGKWAYAQTAPNDIKEATLLAAAALYRASGSNPDTDRPIVTGTGVVIKPSQLPASFWAIINAYKRRT